MERDDNAELFDRADTFDNREDEAYDNWRQRELDEREQRLEEALTEAKEKGVSVESLRVLCFETGALRWSLKESLKGNGDATHG